MSSHPFAQFARPRLAGLPMTVGSLRRLRSEVHRLRSAMHHPGAAIDGPDGRERSGATNAAAALDLHRLQALEAALEAATVVEASAMAIVGSRVTVREADGTQVVLTLVPPGLAVPRDGRISPDSPLGEALLGRTAGERAHVAAPAGTREITIVDVT